MGILFLRVHEADRDSDGHRRKPDRVRIVSLL
jgi:hypothetical protein